MVTTRKKQMSLNCSSFDKNSTDWVICQYRKGLKGMLKYYDKETNYINYNFISPDFSELFVYMYNTKNTRLDFKLIDYIFKDIPENFEFVLMPPTIFEIKRHYDYLRRTKRIASIYKEKNETIMNLLNDIDKLNENGKTEFDPLIQKYRSEVQFLLSFDKHAHISSSSGSSTFLAKGFDRLKSLVDNKILQTHDKIYSFQKIKNMNSKELREITKKHNRIYHDLMHQLDSQRKNVDPWNNIIDAEHGALAYGINAVLPSDELMNLFTGSPIPLSIYENDISLNSIKKKNVVYSIPRCPIHVATRLICERELNTDQNKLTILDSADKILGYMMSNNREKAINLLESDLKKNNNLRKVHNMAIQMVYFYDIFMNNEKVLKYFEESLKISQIQDTIPKLAPELPYETQDKLQILAKLAEKKDIFETQDNFEKALKASHKEIYDYSDWIYRKLCKKIGDYDLTLLPPSMRNMFNYIEAEPIPPENP
jgi:hypothetical protein